MANGFKTFAVGEVLTAADVNDYLMEQSISIFADSTARDAQITSPVEGMFCYLADTNTLQYYDGSAWQNTSLTADITGVTAGDGLSGGGTSGDVTLDLDLNELTGATVDVANDSVAIIDATDNSSKKETIADVVSGIAGDGLTANNGQLNARTGRKNYIINGNFDIWQRGTSLTGQTGDKYLSDRWIFSPSGATFNYEQGTFTAGQTDVPNNPNFYADLTITGADDSARLEQRIEDVYTLAGETVTISFWAKYTSNAPTSFNIGGNQNFGSGGSAGVNFTFSSGQTLTTSWQKFTATGTIPSISGKTVGSGSFLVIRPVLNTNNETYDYQIAQVQVEKGSVATDFEVRPIGEELSLCQRYYSRTTSEVTYYGYAMMLAINTTTYRGPFSFVNTMREAPTISYSGSFQFGKSGVSRAPGSSFISTNGFQIDVGGTGFTAGDVDILRADNDSSAYIEADAEL